MCVCIVEDIGDLLKKLKRSQEASNEQREMRIMGTEASHQYLHIRIHYLTLLMHY